MLVSSSLGCYSNGTYHEVESGHEQDHVDQCKPVVLNGLASLVNKATRGSGCILSHNLPLTIRLGLGEVESPDDEEDRRASAEPKQRPPRVDGCVNQRTSKGSGQEIADGITSLEQTGHDTTSCIWAVFKSSCHGVSVETAHGDSEESSAR